MDRTPDVPGDVRESELRIALSPDGAGEISGVDRYPGAMGAALKTQLEPLDESQRRQAIESVLTRSFHGIVVGEISYQGEDDPDAPLVVRWRGRSPQIARPVEGGLVIDSGLLAAELAGRYVRLASRATPLLLRNDERATTSLEVLPPPGARVIADPPFRVQTPFGSYERSDRVTPAGALLRSERLDIGRGRVEPIRYREFVGFAAEVDAAQEQPIRLTVDRRNGAATD